MLGQLDDAVQRDEQPHDELTHPDRLLRAPDTAGFGGEEQSGQDAGRQAIVRFSYEFLRLCALRALRSPPHNGGKGECMLKKATRPSRAQLVLSLTALAGAVTAAALPAGATPPGTNGKLVFERPTRDGVNLFTVGPDGSGLTRLIRLRGTGGDSSWSPDGSKVAFTRARDPEEGPYEIWAVNADGSGLARLTRHRGFSIAPAWSPDGRKIVYATNAGGRDHTGLYVMNSDGSGKRRLTSSRTRDHTDPSWSPDGNTIAFAEHKARGVPRKARLRLQHRGGRRRRRRQSPQTDPPRVSGRAQPELVAGRNQDRVRAEQALRR